MRNMSFMLTKERIKKQQKTVTRRFGWWFLKPGDLIQPVEKCMGLKKGQKVVRIGCPIEIVSCRSEFDCAEHEGIYPYGVAKEECALEGFPELSPDQFVGLLRVLSVHKGQVCNRIQFKYVKGLLSCGREGL
ncbi:MAG TPA: ASCH domain-containing protein [Alphaproteobacteria bacterium]|nr:ASCH domain-containing protein [Alphaproteobacteria bacterium]